MNIHGVTSLWLRRVNSLNGSNVQSLQARATAIWNGTSWSRTTLPEPVGKQTAVSI
jgi:hypothetical protein